MAEFMALAKGPVDGAERATLDESQRAAAKLHRSATGAAGGGGYAPGSGVDGVGTVKPGTEFAGAGGATNTVLYSIPFPLFYPGPSPEQRRRDSIVHADNMARFARLRARADSIAKARIVP